MRVFRWAQNHDQRDVFPLRATEEEQSAGRAQFLMSQALDADEGGNAEEACELYMQVIRIFARGMILSRIYLL